MIILPGVGGNTGGEPSIDTTTPRSFPTARFAVAAATVIGTDHHVAGRNNQDAVAVIHDATALVGIVCDGCGSGLASEVGAQLGARLFAATLHRLLSSAPSSIESGTGHQWMAPLLHEACHQVLGTLAQVAAADARRMVPETLLFTVLGFVATPSICCMFAHGDGSVAINGAWQQLGPFPDNRPPYLGYHLECPDTSAPDRPREPTPLPIPAAGFWTLLDIRPTAAVETAVLATDGIDGLGSNRDATVAEWVADPRHFANPDRLRRTLTVLNRPRSSVETETHRMTRYHPPLHDDTTVLLVRRCEDPDREEADHGRLC